MSSITKFFRFIFTLLTFIIAISALSISGLLYKQANEYQQHFASVLKNTVANNAWQIDRLNMQILQLQTSESKINSSLANITGNTTILFQVNELINMANQSLIVYNDIPAAIKLLTQARNMLTNAAQFVSLKYAMANDIEQLNHIVPVDKVSVVVALDNAKQLISQLNLSVINTPPSVYVQSQHMSFWHIFVQHIGDTLKQLVYVSQPASIPTLLPKEQALVIDAITVEFLNARISLMTHDAPSWHNSVQGIISLVNMNFIQDKNVTHVIQQLNQLNQIDVSMPINIQLDATLRQLIKLNNLYQ